MKTNTEMQVSTEMLPVLERIYELKGLQRSGWIQSGIPQEKVETVASHSFGMSILVLSLAHTLPEQNIDVNHALAMAVIHDVAESIVGDITPEGGVDERQKHQREAEAMQTLMSRLPLGADYEALWHEYEQQQTETSRFIRRMDKLDMLIQASIYEEKEEVALDSFWEEMDELFTHTESETIYQQLVEKRREGRG